MIKYRLICKNCDISFDSWFASSKEFEKLKKKNFLSCHNCQSKKIENLNSDSICYKNSKNEIINAFKTIKKNKTQFTIKDLEKNLYTKGMHDPDLLIITGGKKRLSNFLLWQLAYTEIFFEKKLWPDFNEKDYTKIITKYKKTKRNFGNI